MLLGVFAGGVAFAADENAHHAGTTRQDIIDFQRVLGLERLVHQLLTGLQVHDAGTVGGQRVPHAGNGGKRLRHTACRAAGSGQHRHATLTGRADGRQRAGGDLLFIVENSTVKVQRHKADVLHSFTLLIQNIVSQNRTDCKVQATVLQ